jgi:hypothetical protein
MGNWDTTQASRRSLLRMNFDASSSYDPIIPIFASLAATSFGQHQTLCFIHATFLRQAKDILKTKLGLSSKMELVLKHFWSSTMVTTQLHIALSWCLRMSGISKPIVEFPSITLPQLETSFFPSLRAYLSSSKTMALDAPVASFIFHLMWTHCYIEWIVRNQALQGRNDQPRQLVRLHQAQYRIPAMYELRNNILVTSVTSGFISPPNTFSMPKPPAISKTGWL